MQLFKDPRGGGCGGGSGEILSGTESLKVTTSIGRGTRILISLGRGLGV